MLIAQNNEELSRESLDLSMSRIERDWHGHALDVPACFGLALDPSRLWFVASRDKAATSHPAARPGKFVPGLWQYDVAEFFLHDSRSGRYLEFNLAPNGAWWSAEFTAPRVRQCVDDVPIPGVSTYCRASPAGHWQAAAAIPLDFLREHFDFGEHTGMNVTLIIDSPEQKFLTATPASAPPGGEPDFHRIDLFEPIRLLG